MQEVLQKHFMSQMKDIAVVKFVVNRCGRLNSTSKQILNTTS